MKAPPLIVAHRGLHDVHPENSIGAFRAAWDAGFEWCECDVQLTRNGEWVVIHDDTLDRTTDGAGPAVACTLAELRQRRLRAGGGNLTGETLPALSELLAAMRAGERLLIEIKPKVLEPSVWRALAAAEREAIMIQSFHPQVVADATEIGCRTAWLADEPNWAERIDALPGDVIHVRHDLLERATVNRCRAVGKRVGAWTVNDLADIRRILELDVDMIITDVPQRVLHATAAIESGK